MSTGELIGRAGATPHAVRWLVERGRAGTTAVGCDSRALCGPAAALKLNKKCRPFGKNAGKRWPSFGPTSVMGVGSPPADGTRRIGENGAGEKMMTPWLFQEPPRPFGASHSVWIAPAVSAVLFNFPCAKNPTHCLSGDQKGYVAPSVPESGRESTASRIHRREGP